MEMEFGLIGEKLGHSFSPVLHERFGNPEYGLLEIPKDRVEEYLEAAPFRGINVTIPYKETAMRHCIPSGTAKAIGCVNTLVKRPEGIFGYNTDTLGFSYMVREAEIVFKDREIYVLGSGGTSKTACYTALSVLGAASVTVVSRSERQPDPSAEGVRPIRFITYDILKEELTNNALNNECILVNTTPAGMFPDISGIPVDPSLLDCTRIKGVVDVIYNPLRTRLVLEAEKRGIPAVNGLSMLAAQAFYAEKLFFGGEVPDPASGSGLSEKEEENLRSVIFALRAEKENLVLIGMPGCGKSTAGAYLSEKTGRKLYDTDELFLEKHGMTAGECILKYGEEAFREKESGIIRELAGTENLVIATGGGAILRSENVDLLKANGRLIFIHRPFRELATGGRPLSEGTENRKGLYYRRLPIYMSIREDLILNRGSKEEFLKALEELSLSLTKAKKGKKPMKILIINGPNLNMLGIREPSIYGVKTYADLMEYIKKEAETLGVSAEFYQSNHEGDLVDAIQDAYGIFDGIVINPGAYTHTSVALLDAVKAVGIPTVEVHISDVDEREEFRKTSYIRLAAIGTVSGKGFAGYADAMRMLVEKTGNPR